MTSFVDGPQCKFFCLLFTVAGYGTNRGSGAPNLVLSYNKATRKFENLAIDDPQSPYYEIRNEKGKAIGVAGKKLQFQIKLPNFSYSM